MIEWGPGEREGLESGFLQALDRRLGPLSSTWRIVYGRRSSDEQAALYRTYLAGGPRAAPPGLSPHEYGLAVDVVLLLPGGKVSWDDKRAEWKELYEVVDASPELHSGRWFGDGGHIEQVKWRKHVV